ncbi:MAG: hypothetical protein AAF329_03865 [Cyanobacteria bacterium P01_A01_bin.17]
MTGHFSLNLRYILWQQDKPQENWELEVATWAKCSEERALELLKHTQPSEPESEAISQATNYSQDELVFSNLLEESGLDIWQENVAYLVNSLAHGENSKLAKALDVASSTISKWKNRQQRPEKTHRKGLYSFFEVPGLIDLEKDPIFLDLSPIFATAQRAWLHRQIDQLKGKTIQALFPALERLLRDS